jgi:two-component system, NarL family, response regulator LiaR
VAGVRAVLASYRKEVDVVELDVDRNPDSRVDVALFDPYSQPGMGVPPIRSLAEDDNVSAVAVYTWSLTSAARSAARRAGARGLIAKTVPVGTLVGALQALAAEEAVETAGFRGGSNGTWPGAQWHLTARDSETLALLSTGMANRDIAEALFVSENTVRTHLKAIFRKLSVTNRSQAVARALADPAYTSHRNPPNP